MRTKRSRESEGQYRDLYEDAPCACFSFGKDACVTDCNKQAERLLGLSREELLGKPVADLYADTPSGKPRALRVLEQLQVGKPIEDEEMQIQVADGSLRWISLAVNPVKDAEGHVVAFRSVVTDISELKAALERESRLLRHQRAINELTLALGDSTDLETLYRTTYEHVRVLMDAEAFIISSFDEDQKIIRAGFVINQGVELDVSGFPPIPLEEKGHGTQSQAIWTGQAVFVRDWRRTMAETATEFKVDDDGTVTPGPPPPEVQQDSVNSALCVPMKMRGVVRGVIQTQSHELDAYGQEDGDLLSGLANVTAIAIHNARLLEEATDAAASLRRAFHGTAQALSAIAEERDPYTAGHQRRVTQLACAIAERIGLAEDKLEGLRVAALLHDIGKMSIPAEILSKPSRLSRMEFALIKGHPEVAFKLLAPIHLPWPVAEIVVQHHERLDGSGYPEGLKGDAILLEARILGVADVVEAIASHRPYRPALGIDVALREIEKHKGDLYDAAAADACIALFREESFEFSPI